MPSHRSLRIAEAIREVVATAILFEVADPRVRAVTVLGVEVSADLRHAKVQVSIMGTEAQRQRALQGLNHAAGFLQARVAARLQTRFTPILSFQLDDRIQKAIELRRLIDEAVASDQRTGRSPSEPISEAQTATPSQTADREPTGADAEPEEP